MRAREPQQQHQSSDFDPTDPAFIKGFCEFRVRQDIAELIDIYDLDGAWDQVRKIFNEYAGRRS